MTISRRPYRLVEDFPESDDIDNEDMAYIRKDCEGVYVEEDTINGKKRKMI